MSKPDFDLLVSWVVNDVKDSIEDTIGKVTHYRMERWTTRRARRS